MTVSTIRTSLAALLLYSGVSAAILTGKASLVAPTVKLDNGTFIGAASGQVNKFLGIPYAQPPCVSSLLFLRIPLTILP